MRASFPEVRVVLFSEGGNFRHRVSSVWARVEMFNRRAELPNIVVQDIAHSSTNSGNKKDSDIEGGSEGGW